MATLSDNVFDSGLNYITSNADEIHICSQEPADYTEATSTYSLGNGSTTAGAAQDRTGGGREVVIAAVSTGSVTGTGTATHYAVIDSVSSELLATGDLSSSVSVTSGNNFTLTAISVGIPDPA